MTHTIKKFKNGIYRNTLRVKADRPNINDLRFKNAFSIDRTKWKAKTTNTETYQFVPFDQGELGSCTANSLAKHFRFAHKLDYDVSRLFIYYMERAMEGTIESDAGAELRDGMKVLASLGAPPETDWPYDVSQFTVKPNLKAISDGKKELAHKYYRLADVDDIKQVLNDNHVFSFGFTCYATFETQIVSDTAYLPLPKYGEEAIGGHAVLGCDYGVASDFLSADTIKKLGIAPTQEVIKVLNSWGDGFGQKGFFYMPIEYFKDAELVTDMWTIFPD